MPLDTKDFDPNGPGQRNGNFIGLPFDEDTAQNILLPVAWDVTTSYAAGTAQAPELIRTASLQLDLYDKDAPNAWKKGIYMLPANTEQIRQNQHYRTKAEQVIAQLESGKQADPNMLADINDACKKSNNNIYEQSKYFLKKNKKIGLIGGEHSVPLGYLRALAEHYKGFGILQIDAHCDLRNAYEGFTYSHASIMYNALQIPNIQRIVQVGIRDYCEEEYDYIQNSNGRVVAFFDEHIKAQLFEGATYNTISDQIIAALPEYVYISFDMDGLTPALCPNTGTPVPGGLSFEQAIFLIKKLRRFDKKIIGFDVSETGHAEWDANVAARVIYKMVLECCSS